MKRKLLTLTLTLLCFLTLSQIHAQEHKYKKYEAKMVGEWQVSDVQARKPVLKSKKNTVSPTATSHINSFKGSTATLNEDGTITFKTGEGKLYSGEWDITKEMERSIGQGMGTGNYDQYYMNMVAKLATETGEKLHIEGKLLGVKKNCSLFYCMDSDYTYTFTR